MSKEKKPLYDPQTGIHRAKGWEIALYALNNTSTNLYAMAFMYVSYFLVGIVGVGVALAGTLTTLLRVWDGVTDPFIGFVVDKTDGKFGKNRPFILLGQICMIIGTALIFLVCPNLSKSLRLPFYIVCYMFYIIGYTFQCVVTKSAQTCLTNDPKQRPVFSVYDSIYNTIVFTALPIVVTSVLVPMYNTYDASGTVTIDAFSNPSFFRALWLICAGFSVVFAILAIIGLWRKDRSEFFGTGTVQRIRLRDYVEVLKKNRAIQMLCVAACSDKLTLSMQSNSVVFVMLFGIIVGDYSKYSAFSGIVGILGTLVPILLIMVVARNMGQKKALIVGTYGGIIGAVLLFLLLRFGDPTIVNFAPLNLYTVAFVVLYVIMRGFGSLSSSIVIPMTADCADYEVYRSGRYVPGLMGTLFSFIDKLISSLATTFVSLLLVMIGFRTEQPTYTTPYSEGIFWVTMFCLLGAPIIGWILNLIAMKFYPLTKEKMASIQERIAEIKAEQTNV
jgi:Na+/melibiose symporter-like transporter